MISWITKDWGIKLISLILAVGLWYYAVGEEDIEVKRTVPLEISLENAQMSVLKSSTKILQVTLAAPRAQLADLASEGIVAHHKIGSEAKSSGDYSFRINASEIELPNSQIRVIKIEPEVIQVTLDELIAKKLKVEPVYSGEPAFGYTVVKEEIQLDPNAILVEGPKGQLQQLDSIQTERIDLVGRIRSFRRTVKLVKYDNIKPISEDLIDAYIPIKEEYIDKEFTAIPVKAVRHAESNEKVKVTPPNVGFTLKGSKRRLADLTSDKILAYVDASELERGEHEVPVSLVLPEDVTLKEDHPVNVKLEITK